MKNTRRGFLRDSGLLTAGLAVGSQLDLTGAEASTQTNPAAPSPAAMGPLPTKRRGDMVYRQLGRTGEEVSLIGLGGFHIGKQPDEASSIRIIHTALDRGINFLDNSWDYNDGVSEVRMGKALKGGRRDNAFLMTKLDGRTKESAARQIDESLLRLQVTHVDLLQFHEIIRMEDPDRIFAKGGALEAALAAKKAGKVRYIGFTGHKDPLIHRRMLEVAAQHKFHFDTVQMPVNVMDAHFRSFQAQVLPVALREGIGVLGMKTFGDPYILEHVTKSKTATPIQLLHYSMSQPVSVVITGIDSLKILDQALEAARTYQPMSKAQKMALLSRTRLAANTGEYEKFKTSMHFDSTAKKPEMLG